MNASSDAQAARSSQALLNQQIVHCLDDVKAEEIVLIDLTGKSSLADAIIIANGRSNTHVGAISDRLARLLKDQGISAKIEGQDHCDWVLIDAGDTIVHVFRPEVRQFYNLEKMWTSDKAGEIAAKR